MTQPGIPLAELIDAVRGELEAAAVNARGQQLQFEVQDVKLEVEVTVTASKEIEGGVKVWVVTAGGKGAQGSSSTHKVTLSLGAVTPSGNKFKVSDVAQQSVRRA